MFAHYLNKYSYKLTLKHNHFACRYTENTSPLRSSDPSSNLVAKHRTRLPTPNFGGMTYKARKTIEISRRTNRKIMTYIFCLTACNSSLTATKSSTIASKLSSPLCTSFSSSKYSSCILACVLCLSYSFP